MEDEMSVYKEMLDQAKEIKDKLGLQSLDTALHLLTIEAIDSLRADYAESLDGSQEHECEDC